MYITFRCFLQLDVAQGYRGSERLCLQHSLELFYCQEGTCTLLKADPTGNGKFCEDHGGTRSVKKKVEVDPDVADGKSKKMTIPYYWRPDAQRRVSESDFDIVRQQHANQVVQRLVFSGLPSVPMLSLSCDDPENDTHVGDHFKHAYGSMATFSSSPEPDDDSEFVLSDSSDEEAEDAKIAAMIQSMQQQSGYVAGHDDDVLLPLAGRHVKQEYDKMCDGGMSASGSGSGSGSGNGIVPMDDDVVEIDAEQHLREMNAFLARVGNV